MALKAGINANQLHKWIREHKLADAAVMDGVEPVPSAFVPVVAIGDVVMPAVGRFCRGGVHELVTAKLDADVQILNPKAVEEHQVAQP